MFIAMLINETGPQCPLSVSESRISYLLICGIYETKWMNIWEWGRKREREGNKS